MNSNEFFFWKTAIGGAVLYAWSALILVLVLIFVTIGVAVADVIKASKKESEESYDEDQAEG